MRVACFHLVAHSPQNKPVFILTARSGCLFLYLNAAHLVIDGTEAEKLSKAFLRQLFTKGL